jgi:hypothetical protein
MQHLGTISRKGNYVEGSLKQEAWMDRSLSAHTINYDGELTQEICERIVEAYNDFQNKHWKHPGICLRTPQKPVAKYVDVENRQLIVEQSSMLCD